MTRLVGFGARALALVVIVGACNADERALGLRASTPRVSSFPGSHGRAIACSQRAVQRDSALVGPSGGTLVVGQSRLIIPPGALLEPTMIVGTMSESAIPTIHLEPTGLVLRKPAGLQLDVSGCDVAEEVPDVEYIDDSGSVVERIEAVFSNLWKAVAAPISHFSAYQIAL
jgi:hypothetical protein